MLTLLLLFEVIAKDTNNISYIVRYGLGVKAELVRNLPQIFVILAQSSWQLTILAFYRHSSPKFETKQA